MTYRNHETYSGHTQDIERLVRTAAELNASEVEIRHSSGTNVVVRWEQGTETYRYVGDK